MTDIRVQDEQGTTHVFPDGSTPEMIAKVMGVKPPVPATDAQGFQPMRMTSPNGQDELVPHGDVMGKLRSGYKIGLPAQQSKLGDQIIPKVSTDTSKPWTAAAPLQNLALGAAAGAGVPESQTPVKDLASAPFKPSADPRLEAAAQGMAQGVGMPGAVPVARVLAGIGGASADQGSKAIDAFKEAIRTKSVGPAIAGLIHTAGTIPIVGPAAVNAGEEIGKGIENKSGDQILHGVGSGIGTVGALLTGTEKGQAAIDAATGAAGKAVDLAKQSTSTARQALAQKIVQPLVKSTPSQMLSDAKFGRNPAQALVDEGIIGKDKPSVLSQVQARTADLHDALNGQLANHPNAGVQIDAEPIIDGAINDAVKAAQKQGNKATASRLEDLRDALKTQYGNIKGTPLEINNLKSDVGNVGSDLGAFKHSDPAEASAASAMGDVYTGLKKAVNAQIPQAAPINERIANLLSAKTALNRNIALDSGKGVLDAVKNIDITKPLKSATDIAGSVIGTTPARTAAAAAIADSPKPVPNIQSASQTAALAQTPFNPPVVPKTAARAASAGRPLPTDYKIIPEESINGTDFTMKDAKGKQVGTAGIRDYSGIPGKQVSEVGDIKLTPDQQGKGYGQAFYTEAAKHAASIGDDVMVSSGKPTQAAIDSWMRLRAAHPKEVSFTNGRWQWDLSNMKGVTP